MNKKEPFLNADKILARLEELIYNEMYDFEEAYLIASEEFYISYRTYLKLREVYN